MSRNKILKEDAPEIPDLILRLQSQAKDKHISKDKLIKTSKMFANSSI